MNVVLRRGSSISNVLGGELGTTINAGRSAAGLVGVCSPGLTLISRPGPGGADFGFSYFLANCSMSDREIPSLCSRSFGGRRVSLHLVELFQDQLALRLAVGCDQALARVLWFLRRR